jgi:uncharacterized alkaline shock family protein YloU
MTDVASEIEVRRQADAAGTPAPNGNGAAAPPADEEAAVESPATGAAATGAAASGPDVAKDGAADRVSDAVDRVGEQVNEAVERASEAVERAAAASGRVASAVVERLRNNAELAVERGTTSIADEVVEKIAGIAVREVPGVYDIGGDVARVLAGLKERIGLGDADDETDRGMRVRLQGRTAQVNVTLVIEYGFVVHSVAEKVRTKVINAIENLLGLEVTEVNILVDDVHVPDDARSV